MLDGGKEAEKVVIENWDKVSESARDALVKAGMTLVEPDVPAFIKGAGRALQGVPDAGAPEDLRRDPGHQVIGPMSLTRLIEHAVAAILVLLLIGGMANIILRLTEGGGLIWFNDLSRYLLVWLTFIGAAAVSFHRAHITVNDEIVAGLPPVVRRTAELLRHAVVILFLAVVLYEGARLTLQVSTQSFLTVRWLSLGFGYVALPLSAALMLIASVLSAVRDARGRGDGG